MNPQPITEAIHEELRAEYKAIDARFAQKYGYESGQAFKAAYTDHLFAECEKALAEARNINHWTGHVFMALAYAQHAFKDAIDFVFQHMLAAPVRWIAPKPEKEE